jgi:hypothetical protein
VRRVALLTLVLALVAPAEAFAYVRSHVDPNDSSSPCLFWSRRTVPYQLSSRGSTRLGTDAAFTALRKAFQSWTDVGCSDFTYQDLGLSDSVDIGFNKAVLNQPFLAGDVTPQDTVIFREKSCDDVVPASDDCHSTANDDCANKYDCWAYSADAIALTTTSYDYQTGQIFDADIELNEADFDFTTYDPPTPACSANQTPESVDGGCIATDLQNTVTHEAGHMLGLGHTTDRNATMYPSASIGEISKRTLHDDDIAGLCAIYPSGQPVVTCNEPTPTKSGCGCGATPGAGLLSALGLLALRRRRQS